MHRRLTLSEFYAVRRALAAGMRHTEIARELDLSVWTIDRLAALERYQQDPITEDELPEDDAPPDYLAQNLRRCPGCGAMVYVWPCIACQMATQTQRVPPAPELDDEADADEPPEIEIAPCGRRRRIKRTNWAYRAKLAAQARS
jgi:hypothetical protein